MIGIYALGVLVVLGIAGYIVFKVRWGRADRAERDRRSGKIEDERIEEEAERKRKTQV
jgi:hypothetical protein